jgi:hypothetical protein
MHVPLRWDAGQQAAIDATMPVPGHVVVVAPVEGPVVVFPPVTVVPAMVSEDG